jgi:hypothetical protein
MANYTESLAGLAEARVIPQALLYKHFCRKHGPNAYYGQN